MTTGTAKVSAPPYTSFRTVLNVLDRLQESGIPQRIDRTYWGQFLAGSVGQQVMTALRFLNLIDGVGEPSGDLEGLVALDQRKQRLATLLRERYADAIAIAEPSRATLGQLQGAFRTAYKIDGETLRKATTFFIHAAQYAEIPLSSFIISATKRSGASASGISRRTSGTAAGGPSKRGRTDAPPASTNGTGPSRPRKTTQPQAAPVEPAATERTVTLRSGATLTLSICGNILKLDREDREFVFRLLESVEQYEQAQDAPDGPDESMLGPDEVPF